MKDRRPFIVQPGVNAVKRGKTECFAVKGVDVNGTGAYRNEVIALVPRLNIMTIVARRKIKFGNRGEWTRIEENSWKVCFSLTEASSVKWGARRQ